MKLILGAGKYQRNEGWQTNDVRPFEGIDHVFNLNERWLLKENSVQELSAIHVIEHLNSLIHFMDEAWRVLKQGGTLYIETPLAGADPDMQFADPTHIRCYRKHSFINYFTQQGIDNFGYTDKPWCIMHISDTSGILIVHLMPVK